MTKYLLKFALESDAIFASGEGVAGLVDVDVQHDVNGLPYLGGRTLKGLLVQECADILDAIQQAGKEITPWEASAARLFGKPGEQESMLFVRDATLPENLRQAIAQDIGRGKIKPADVLDSLTTIRRQTAMETSGVPKPHSLRSVRAIIRETPFQAELVFSGMYEEKDLALLATCIKSLRRVGSNRNRGFGRLKQVKLLDHQGEDITDSWVDRFFQEVTA